MTQYLVTGANGFLGRYVVEQLLARGDRVRALCRRRHAELDALGVSTVLADLRDADATQRACQGVDVVFHVAGVAGIWGPWRHYYGINTVGTRNVIEACRQHSVGRLVYTSSPSVTFDGGDACGADESA
ncbi:MAG: NAD-dependent epimerase/dehydratase family protein, partial [Pirellulales bacterium]